MIDFARVGASMTDTGEEMGTSLLSIDFDVDAYLERGGRFGRKTVL
jgi:hypothetical protein